MRYQKIRTHIWQDEKFITLEQNAKYLFMYLLTSPHSNSVGLYVLPKEYICADLGWTMEQLREPFRELLHKGLILYDERVSLLCIKNHLKHNPIENENQAKAATKIFECLPKSSMYSTLLKQLTKPYHEPLREQLRERYGKPETETEEETETETENQSLAERDSNVTPLPGTGTSGVRRSPVFITIPLENGSDYSVTHDVVTELAGLYPRVDVEQALREIRAWNLSHPRQRKTEKGIMAHITGWLARETREANNGNNGRRGTHQGIGKGKTAPPAGGAWRDGSDRGPTYPVDLVVTE